MNESKPSEQSSTASGDAAEAARPATRLKIICVGTGRDGTVSLSHMFRELFDREGAGRAVMHEYMSREFSHCFADFADTGEEIYREQARELIQTCPYDCIVGNGYAPWLPLFAEICGPEAQLVHVRRLDRDRCIASLAENAEMFPLAYGSYSPSPEATWRRMTAFHFGEMSREGWFALAPRDRLTWYFDKTHALIDEHAALFQNVSELFTEELDSPASLSKLGEIAGLPGQAPAPKHLNSHIFAATAEAESRSRMQWLFGQLDLKRAASDEVYPLEYFLNAFIAWTGYQVRRTEQILPSEYRTGEELENMLRRATLSLERTQTLVNLLELERRDRYPTTKDPDTGS